MYIAFRISKQNIISFTDIHKTSNPSMKEEPKSVDEIPSDELVVMTSIFHKAFNVLGCNPACHCCWKKISPGKKFKLATVQQAPARDNSQSGINVWAEVESREVMLCETCTVEKYNQMSQKAIKEYEKYRKSPRGGCFRVNGKIVTEP